jgi:SAM-dependent methyltransferase
VDANDWNSRYDQTDQMWSLEPNMWVSEVTFNLSPGRALDLAAGEGRNAIWLAERGWDATAVDFSNVALDRAVRLARQRLGDNAAQFHVQRADLFEHRPNVAAYDLVLVVYLQVEADNRTFVLRAAADGVAPGGTLLVVAHDTENPQHGYGGPPSPTLLYSASDIARDIDGSGLEITKAEQVVRVVTTPEGPREALDCLVVAKRPPD